MEKSKSDRIISLCAIWSHFTSPLLRAAMTSKTVILPTQVEIKMKIYAPEEETAHSVVYNGTCSFGVPVNARA